jgi:ferredoxin
VEIAIDLESCQGHGRCYDIAPEVFGADDEGHAVLLLAGALPAGQEDRARAAVRNCPERALSLLRAGAGS